MIEMIDTGVPRVSVAGCPVDVISRAQTLKLIERIIADRTPCRHGFVNAAKVVRVQSDFELLDTLSTCDLINADGVAIVWASRILGTPLPERVNGTNLMMDLVQLAHQKGYRLYLLGARPAVVERVAEVFQSLYPELQIVGWHHGYFGLDDEPQIARQIRKAKPDILFVGMGTPQKE